MEDKSQILIGHAGDILNVEKQILESVERQTRDGRVKRHREAYELLIKIQTTLTDHSLALERYLTSMDGGSESFIKRAATSAIGVAFGIYDRLRLEDTVSKSMRNDYTALSHAVISYTIMYTIARALDDRELSDLALEHLTQLTPFIAGLSRVIPTLVAEELTVEGKAVANFVGPEALADTQKAWSTETISTYH